MTFLKYDQFNIKQEEWLASLDSQEPLGSKKVANIRGDLPDINEFPLAGGKGFIFEQKEIEYFEDILIAKKRSHDLYI